MGVDELEPGIELNALVAERVMGWKWFESSGGTGQSILAESQAVADLLQVGDIIPEIIPPYSTDMRAAWEVVEKLPKIEAVIKLRDDDGWWAQLSSHLHNNTGATLDADYEIYVTSTFGAKGETAPLAICRAALRSVEGK